ncbi:MAG: hypothetical protein RIS47_153 [Bacteroidota bacterium]|jgi:hypothetical protein
MQIQLSQELRDYLASHYAGCLCKNCLQKLAKTIILPYNAGVESGD